jgi:cysteine desulfurase
MTFNQGDSMPVYLDCNATTPIEPQLRDSVLRFMELEFGNAGSATHGYGTRALQAVKRSREQIAALVNCRADEVVFTSGATESNNLAILGLAEYGARTGRRHIISSAMEHKAVLETLGSLQKRGFEITLLPADPSGRVRASQVQEALRSDTLLVSIMQVNNETGVIQPTDEIAECLNGHDAFFHVDAAQGFGKVLTGLDSKRIDLISISGHKIFAPKGIGALITRRRAFKPLPLEPIMFGGGQEKGLRPGTLAVPLIVGLGGAAELSLRDHALRSAACRRIKEEILAAFAPLNPVVNGDQSNCVPHAISIAFPGLDSGELIAALQDDIAVSNGSACSSDNYKPSHVLQAMGLENNVIKSTLRISWCHLTAHVDWKTIAGKIAALLSHRPA